MSVSYVSVMGTNFILQNVMRCYRYLRPQPFHDIVDIESVDNKNQLQPHKYTKID